MKIETRNLTGSSPTARGKMVFGYAALFNSRSENLGTAAEPMYEIILPGAFDAVLNDDIVACYNHNEADILARCVGGKGSLKLTVDNIGLRFEFQAPDTQLGRDLLISLQRGDIAASSFSFSVAPGGDTRKIEKDGSTSRTIKKIGKLYDISPVVRPAYKSASVDARKHSRSPHGGDVFIQNKLRALNLIDR